MLFRSAWHLPPCQSQSHGQAVGKNTNSAKVKAAAATVVAPAPLATPSGPRPSQENRDPPPRELRPIPIVSLWEGGVSDRPAGPILLPFCFPAPTTCPKIQFAETVAHLRQLFGNPEGAAGAKEAGVRPSPTCPPSLLMTKDVMMMA